MTRMDPKNHVSDGHYLENTMNDPSPPAMRAFTLNVLSVYLILILHRFSASLCISIASEAHERSVVRITAERSCYGTFAWTISVRLSVCRTDGKGYCGKTADWIRMSFGVVSGVITVATCFQHCPSNSTTDFARSSKVGRLRVPITASISE